MLGPEKQKNSDKEEFKEKIEEILVQDDFETSSLERSLQLSPAHKNAAVDLFLASESGQLGELRPEQTALLHEMAERYIDPSYFDALYNLRKRLQIAERHDSISTVALTEVELREIVEKGPAKVGVETLCKMLLGPPGNYQALRHKVFFEVLEISASSLMGNEIAEMWTELIEDAMAKGARERGEKRSTIEELLSDEG